MPSFLAERRARGRAGRSALRLADEQLRHWRRGHRRFYWSVTAVVGVLVVASFVTLFQDRGLVAWSGGAVAGMALGFLVVVRETGPVWVENRRHGAWAEQRTARELTPLTRRGWHVLHDILSDHGNLDHVLIGPAGVFVVDTKQRSGQVEVDGDTVVVHSPSGGRPRREPGRGTAARAQGRELSGRLRSAGAGGTWVNAVVVLWGDFPARIVRGQDVSFVAGDALVDWLEAQPARLNRPEIERLVRVAASLQTEAGDRVDAA